MIDIERGLDDLIESLPRGRNRVYAIAFDLVVDDLRVYYSATSPTNAYAEIRDLLFEEGFRWQQGSVYFGGAEVDAVRTVEAAQRLGRDLPWFARCVRDIRMLRIEEFNDLHRTVQRAVSDVRAKQVT
jgi:virulence-associated protein VapD